MAFEVISEECQAALAAINSYKSDMRDICASIRSLEEKAGKIRSTQLFLIMEALLFLAFAAIAGSLPYVGWVVSAGLMAVSIGLFVAAAILDRQISGLNAQISALTKLLNEMKEELLKLQDRAREVCPQSCIPSQASSRFICYNDGVQ